MHIKRSYFALSLLLFSAGTIGAAQAGKATGSLQVKVAIRASCTVTSGNNSIMDFGTLDNLNDTFHNAQTDPATNIQVQCSNGIPYSIGLGPGLNPLDYTTQHTRRMKSGSEYVSYYLYTDAARKSIWLDGSEGGRGLYVPSTPGSGTVQKYGIYGQIPQQKTPSAGAYTDTVVVEVNY
ncbi:spore coat U domain-containing protein [Brucella sp. NBRC 12950]|jgi:spore coat protein U-like protein|uniref:Csu type fimbrial protein n=1 Tax=Brucella sp. NBRC 12950 TaxID=2994518 RepID=UPI0024A13C83|nr:spore coat U domain-containing protein [Brucella sp. NBRC 12950]GLU29505.1 biofilm synthesis protein [Brucella sp. NBRC 12950]